MQKQNIFSNIPSDLSKELFKDILKTDCFKMERIISNEHSSPEGFWYDQDQDEWVIVLKGSAALLFKGENKPISIIRWNGRQRIQYGLLSCFHQLIITEAEGVGYLSEIDYLNNCLNQN